ncbi:MAG TPA: zinc ribbon domain-containing protein [Pyrinomonadaceae bacterium]|nr:zinc ribbon domain-containing protein [Pyrinomonadaceae bacterium]
MYCSTCGAAVAQSLSYCNRCGAKLRPAEASLSLDSLVWAVVSLLIAGVGVIIGLMAVMKNVVNFHEGIIIIVTALSFLALLTAEGVLLRMLLGGWKAARGADDAGPPKGQVTRELEEAQPRALPEPVPSVTEQTTRTFEPAYSRRKSES